MVKLLGAVIVPLAVFLGGSQPRAHHDRPFEFHAWHRGSPAWKRSHWMSLLD